MNAPQTITGNLTIWEFTKEGTHYQLIEMYTDGHLILHEDALGLDNYKEDWSLLDWEQANIRSFVADQGLVNGDLRPIEFVDGDVHREV